MLFLFSTLKIFAEPERMGDQYEYDIPSNGKGLFIIIANYYNVGTCDDELNYQSDVERLLNMFNLERKSDNLALGENLTPGSEDDAGSFRYFMKRVEERYESIKHTDVNYKFVMVFLLAHGDHEYCFDLTEQCSKQCRSRHMMKGLCKKVKYYDEIILPMSKMIKDRPVPVLFFMQLCRGERAEADQIRSAVRPLVENQPTQLPHSVGAHLFIVFPCYDGHQAYVKVPSEKDQQANAQLGHGSKFFTMLESSSAELKQRYLPKHPLVDQKQLSLPRRREDFEDGWVENLFINLTAKMAGPLYRHGLGKITVITDSDDDEDLEKKVLSETPHKPDEYFVDKNQVVCTNTLKFKLSWAKILVTQGALDPRDDA